LAAVGLSGPARTPVLEATTMSPLAPRRAIYPGSFDPLTLGHLDIIQRGSALFESLTVGVGTNPEKRAAFTPAERVELIRRVVSPLPNVEVASFDGLTVDFARQCRATVVLRGMRTLSDIEQEFTFTLANRALAPDIETVFLMASERYTHISSTLIKQVALLGGPQVEQQLSGFVPPEIVPALLAKLRPQRP